MKTNSHLFVAALFLVVAAYSGLLAGEEWQQRFTNIAGTPDLAPGHDGESLIDIIQSGHDNWAELGIGGDDQLVISQQQGEGNRIYATSHGSDNTIFIVQSGMVNHLQLDQAGIANQIISQQLGNANQASIIQINSDNNVIMLQQIGNENRVELTQANR